MSPWGVMSPRIQTGNFFLPAKPGEAMGDASFPKAVRAWAEYPFRTLSSRGRGLAWEVDNRAYWGKAEDAEGRDGRAPDFCWTAAFWRSRQKLASARGAARAE